MLRTMYRYSNLLRTAKLGRTPTSSSSYLQWAKRLALPSFGLAYYAFAPSHLNHKEDDTVEKILQDHVIVAKVESATFTTLLSIWTAFVHVLRFMQLLVIFSPTIILSPLLFFERTQDAWFDLFVKAVERSGVVFIKTFQYLSHRRDIIGAELATKFSYLRENAPTHQFSVTEQYFKTAYDCKIEDIFDQFDIEPIASGSVSQVYRANYKGKKVAVKVRHPNVDKHIERDVNLLFFLSYLASFISPTMEVPVGKDSLKKTLTDQIDFTFEMRNLNKFRQMFKGRSDVLFPNPIASTTIDTVLVESFVQGMPITYYQTHEHKLNKVIAKLGSEVLFEMLMKNNFVHADCHGGNFFVSYEERPYNFFTEVWDFLKDVWYVAKYRIKAETVSEDRIKQVYLQYCKQESAVRKLIRTQKQKVVLNVIDAGMVVELDETDKRNFSNFIKSIIECRGNDCANMIFCLSNYEGQKVTKNASKFTNYHGQLTTCFNRLNNSTYSQLEGMAILWDMMRIIRENKMKLDGQFATLLTNIIVLEGIGRSLDPEINILKCAFPYFKYIEEESDPIVENTELLMH